MKTLLCVPTLNAEKHLERFLKAFGQQTYKPDIFLVIDSSSTDETVQCLKVAGALVTSISPSEFDHGGTRQKAIDMVPDADIIYFLTQDAILAKPDSLAELLSAFDDPEVGAAYGCQLPNENATPIEAHARHFNYPDESKVKGLEDAPVLGIKTAFISNSFAAYRRTALMRVGGFPVNTILSEDIYVASRMLHAGWKIAYSSSAKVYHSHNYTPMAEFRRYFDHGVFHSRERWIRQSFGEPEGEGLRFLKSEICYLLKDSWFLIPSCLLRTALKYVGYKLGGIEKKMPTFINRQFSMNKLFWPN